MDARDARTEEEPREQRPPSALTALDRAPTPAEKVTEASEESFPASDAPGWVGGSATPSSDRDVG